MKKALRGKTDEPLVLFANLHVTNRSRWHDYAATLRVGDVESASTNGVGHQLCDCVGREVRLNNEFPADVLYADADLQRDLLNRADVTITYRRGVLRRFGGIFAGRGITLPGFVVSASVIVAAFALGMGAGWFTSHLPEMLEAEPSATPSPSPSPVIDISSTPSLPPMPPITRTLDQDDRDAGIVTTEVDLKGEGIFNVVKGVGTPAPTEGDIRWVSVAVEEGVSADPVLFRSYVMNVLNDNRAWGSGDSIQYVHTDGVADYRVILASPYTAATMCPDDHEAVQSGPVVPVSPSPVATPESNTTAVAPPAVSGMDTLEAVGDNMCADDSVVVVSIYDWTAGIATFADDYQATRQFLLLHRLGHLTGNPDATCVGGRADVMVNQYIELPEGCEPNPWPFPDAPVEVEVTTPTQAPGATAPR